MSRIGRIWFPYLRLGSTPAVIRKVNNASGSKVINNLVLTTPMTQSNRSNYYILVLIYHNMIYGHQYITPGYYSNRCGERKDAFRMVLIVRDGLHMWFTNQCSQVKYWGIRPSSASQRPSCAPRIRPAMPISFRWAST